MSEAEAVKAEAKRFKDFLDSDLMIRHCLAAADGTERVVYEVGAVRRMVWYFDWLESVLKHVAKSKQPPLIIDKHGCRLTADAKALWHALRNIDEAPRELCEGRRLSPWLRVGLHLANKWEPRLRDCTSNNGTLDGRLACVQKAIAHIFKVIRRVRRSKRFRALINNDARNASDNYLSCCEYMLDVLRCHARPLVVRIDLYFEGDAKVFSESKAAAKAYNKFIRSLRGDKIVQDVLAYIGKRENGLERRIHFHLLIVLDGNKHRQAYGLTEELGRYWVDDCVGSPAFASYANCFLRKDEYEYCCIGLLHYADENMLKGLRNALKYLCKEGAHVLVGKGMGRNLRKGQSPQFPADAKRPGAPRKYGNDVAVAERILLAKERVAPSLHRPPRVDRPERSDGSLEMDRS